MTTPKTAPKKKAASPPVKAARKPRARREPVEREIDLAKAVNLALAGATFKQIASELEVDEETVRYHLVSAEGQRALRYAVNDLQERTDRFLASAHLQAIRRLVREMEEADKPGDRIRAAQAITMLAAKRIEITGANGAPIEVDTSVATLLDERISLMRERSRSIIDTTGVTNRVLVESVDEEVESPENLTNHEAVNGSHGSEAPLPELAVVPTPVTRNRQPAGLSPGQSIRARR
jgi:predicted transcriptional regulator